MRSVSFIQPASAAVFASTLVLTCLPLLPDRRCTARIRLFSFASHLLATSFNRLVSHRSRCWHALLGLPYSVHLPLVPHLTLPCSPACLNKRFPGCFSLGPRRTPVPVSPQCACELVGGMPDIDSPCSLASPSFDPQSICCSSTVHNLAAQDGW